MQLSPIEIDADAGGPHDLHEDGGQGVARLPFGRT
jgi:hypothetical protein